MSSVLTFFIRAIFKKAAYLLLVLSAASVQALEQAQFDELLADLQAGKLESVADFLDKNPKLATTDPDYTVLLLNHGFMANRNSRLIVAQGEPEEGDYELASLDDPSVKGFMREQVTFNNEAIIKVIQVAQKNLKSFPEYLDIHFGIAAIASGIGEWKIATEQLVSMLKHSREIDNQWKWGKVGGIDGAPEEFMIQSVLPYSSELYRLETPETDQLLIQLSEALIQYYPKKVYGYANLGSFYAVTGKKEKAREYYQKALEVDPDDQVVKQNLEYLNRP